MHADMSFFFVKKHCVRFVSVIHVFVSMYSEEVRFDHVWSLEKHVKARREL